MGREVFDQDPQSKRNHEKAGGLLVESQLVPVEGSVMKMEMVEKIS